MRNLLLCILFCFSFLSVTGCWDHQELNEISLITGLALDKGEKSKYTLTVESLNAVALNPKIGGEQSASIVFSLQGENVVELLNQLNQGMSRNLVFSHMRTVVIGKDLAEDGLLDFFDFMERYWQIRNDFNIVVADNVPASEVLKITYPLQKVSTLKLYTQLRTMAEVWGGDTDTRLRDFINALVSPGREPLTTVVKVLGSPEKGKTNENLKMTDPDAMVVLDGMAVFKGLTYVGKLSIRDTRNYMWIDDKLNQTSVTVSCDEQDDSQFNIEVTKTVTEIKADYNGDKPIFIINIDFESRLDAYKCKTQDIGQLETYSKLEKQLSEAIESNILATIHKVQKDFKADIFGFGEHMERQNYSRFQETKDDWNEEFARANFKVNVNTKIRRTGLSTDSFLKEMQ